MKRGVSPSPGVLRRVCLSLLCISCLSTGVSKATEFSRGTIGYLGASNDTSTANKILGYLRENNSKIRSLEIENRMTNKCEVGDAVQNLFELLHTKPDLLVLVVFSCTKVLKVIGEFVPFHNLTVLGLGSSSAVLKNQVKYPTLQLLSEVENTHSSARLSFVETKGWTRVATLAEDYEDYTLAAENFYKATENSTVKVAHSMTLVHASIDINNKIKELSAEDVRIIFMFGTQKVLEDILLSMTSQRFFEARRVIIFNQDMPKVPENVDLFYIGSASNQGRIKSSSDEEYPNIIHSLLRQIDDFLQSLPVEKKNSHLDREYFSKNFVFHGNFTTSIYRYNKQTNNFELLSNTLNKTVWTNAISDITWPDGKQPLDKKDVVIEYNETDGIVLYIFCALCVTCMMLALALLIVNCKYKSLALIKLSSPILNSVNIIGSICLYTVICIMGLAHPRLSIKSYQATCMLRNFFLSIGFSLAFGPMLAKAYRVHYIFTSTERGKVSSKKLKDRNLLLFNGCLVVLDTAFIISWQFVDPFSIEEIRTFEPDKSDIDTTVYSYSYTCSCLYMTKWLGIVYAYKGIILMLGVYLAWNTRNVSIATLNDSKSIIINIYIVFAASIIVVIASMFLQHDATLSYSIIGSLIFLTTTTMLSILFVPKVISLLKMPRQLTNRQITNVVMGGIVESSNNTRRFEPNLTEAIKELERASELLRAELTELDEEIERLQQMSCRPSLKVTDMLTADLLYIIPLPYCEPLERETDSRLTRRNTPKYKIRWKKQQELLVQLKMQQTLPNTIQTCLVEQTMNTINFRSSIEEEDEEGITEQ